VVVAESVQNAFVFECLIRSASGQRPAFLERFQRRVAAADEPLLREMIVVGRLGGLRYLWEVPRWRKLNKPTAAFGTVVRSVIRRRRS
jgi:hypothetical protein